MSNVNWGEILGWNVNQLEELRLAGFGFLREGKYDKALLFFKVLILINPDNVYDMQTLGALYLQMGNGELALKFLNNAIALETTHEPTLLNKAKALLLIQRKNEALELARQLQVSSDPTIAGDAQALISAYS